MKLSFLTVKKFKEATGINLLSGLGEKATDPEIYQKLFEIQLGEVATEKLFSETSFGDIIAIVRDSLVTSEVTPSKSPLSSSAVS